nr:helveticin J family class III bacteriocin [Paenibacillus agaridevorans]
MLQVQTSTFMKKQVKRIGLVIFSIMLWGTSVMSAFAATPQKTVNASATLAYNILGLNHNKVVQKAYIGSTYLYVTQRDEGNCYLSRLSISGNNATYMDEMAVTNAGHCQTLDMYEYNGENYFYFSSKADPSTERYWSLQVSRLQYSPGQTYNYTDLHRFTYMNYANAAGTKLGDTYRVDGGGNGSYTIFRIQTKQKTVTWSIYDTDKLNQLLDNNQQVRMDSVAARNAIVTSFTQSGSAIVRPNESFQGVDIYSHTKIYTSGGVTGDTPQIALMSNNGTYKTLVNITNLGALEIEGVQPKYGNVYFTIVPDPVNKQNTQKVYYVPDTVFN